MSDLTLYDHLDEQSRLFQIIKQNEGELSDELILAIKENSVELAYKLDSWVAIIEKTIPTHAKECAEEEVLWKARKVALNKKADWMRETLLGLVKSSPGQKLAGLRHILSLKTNPASLSLKDPEAWNDIPPDYIKFEVKIDKAALKRDWDILPQAAKAQLKLEADQSLNIKEAPYVKN